MFAHVHACTDLYIETIYVQCRGIFHKIKEFKFRAKNLVVFNTKISGHCVRLIEGGGGDRIGRRRLNICFNAI